MQDLEQLRAQIDDIDTHLLGLLSKRQLVVKQVGEYKQKNNIAVFDPIREEYLLSFHKSLSDKYQLSFEFIKNLFQMIMEESKRTQRQG